MVLEACILHLACIGSTAKRLENAQQEPVPLSQIPHRECFSKRSFLLRRWAWCLPCGFDHIVPYFYVIYFGALLGEQLHNLENFWKEYLCLHLLCMHIMANCSVSARALECSHLHQYLKTYLSILINAKTFMLARGSGFVDMFLHLCSSP